MSHQASAASHHPPAAPYDFYCREPACDARAEVAAPDHRTAAEDARALGWDPVRSLCPGCADAARFVRGLREDPHAPIPQGPREEARNRLASVVSRTTGPPGPPFYLLAERLPGMLGGLEEDPSASDPWAWAIRLEMLYALAEGEADGLHDLPRAVVERIAEVSDPSEWLTSSHARWLYTSRAISAGHQEDLSEAVWDGLRLEVERAMHALIGPMLDDHRGS